LLNGVPTALLLSVPWSVWNSLRLAELAGNEFRSGKSAVVFAEYSLRTESLFAQVFADGLRHLEHIQSGFSKHWLQLFIGYNFPPLLWVAAGIWERVIPVPRPIVERALKALEPFLEKRRLSFSS